MKKQLLTLALLAVAGTAGAQQLPNGSFDEGNWVDCVPWTSTGYKSVQGLQPVSWTISNVKGLNGGDTGATTIGAKVQGRQGNAVQVENKKIIMGQIVPGYFTLGTTWSTAKVSGITPTAKDGGTFGGIDFAYKPDALKFYYKRSCSGTNTRSSVIAYLWNGSTSQANVPGVNASNPKKVTMADRDINVLNMSTDGHQGGAVTYKHKLIAKIESYTTEQPTEWTEWTIPFVYVSEKSNETPEKINVIFAASDYFNSSNVTAGVKLCIDDVSLVYYKHLKSLTIDGTTPSTFVGDDTQNNTNEVNIDASDKYYTEGCISAKAAGAGAKVNETYNSSTHVCTLKVTAGDGEVKNYNIQFGVPCTGKLSSLTVNGTVVELVADKYYYVVTGDYAANSVSYVKEDGDKATAAKSYDADKHISTIKVTAPGVEDHTYYVKFAKTGDKYMSNLFIGMGGLLAHPQQNVEIAKGDAANTIDLQLRDFKLGEDGDPIGDIFVYGIPCNPVNGSATLHKVLTKDDNFRIFGDGGSSLVLPNLVLDGDLTNGKLNVALTITWDMTGEGDENSYAPILVKVYSPSATSVDLSDENFTGAGSEISKILGNFSNSPIVYLPEGEEVNGVANVVVGTTASSLSLADGNDWGVTKDFTAAAVSYDRAFNTEDNYVQSFVLPFGFTVPEGTTVAELSSVNGDNLVFKPVAETVANKPYLVVTTDKDFINKLENVQVKATTGADLTTTVDNVSHIGSYTAQSVTDAYGYANGKFVKANTGSVKPFRTYIKVAGTQAAPMAFGVNIEGTVTGINNATTAATAKEAIYNLQGVRVSGDLKHLTKGVYIVNGQKVVVK